MNNKKGVLLAAALAAVALPALASPLPWNSPELNTLNFLMQKSGNGDWVQSQSPPSEAYALELLETLKPHDGDQQALRQDLLKRLRHRTVTFGSFELTAESRGGYFFEHAPPLPLLQVQAAANTLLEQNEGFFTTDGNLGYVGARLTGQLTPYLQFAATPLLRLTEGDAYNDKTSFFLPEGLLTLQYGGVALEAGRSTVRWGLGRAGSLLFSAEAEPFNLVRLRSDRALLGPWILKYLGPTRFEVFATYLEHDRVFPYTRIIGVHFSWQPHPRFEFSLGQSVMFGGKGAPTNNPLVYFTEKVSDDPNPANRNFLATFRWRVPVLEIEPYAEIMLEDCCDGLVVNARDAMTLCGLYFPRIDASGKADLALEWVRTNQIAYRHSTFTSGYTYKNRMLGHPLGPDATGIYALFRYFYSPALAGKLIFAFEQRGRLGKSLGNEPIETVVPTFQRAEQLYRVAASADWRPWPALTLTPDLGFQRVANWQYQRGVEKYQGLFGLQLRYLF